MAKPGPAEFEQLLEERAAAVEEVLRALLDDQLRATEIARPPRLLEAMRYGVLNGGKRLRPFLVIESAALFGFDGDDVVRTAAALECVHCYSLIHDDLPSMDDDAIRRGQPTVHKAFDEATAILAGDALLTYAFEILADAPALEPPDAVIPPGRRLDLILCLARAAGLAGMAGGQALDLEAKDDPPDEIGVVRLQAMKTGALLRFACEAGAILAGAPPADRERLAEFGSAIGLAFQLSDDLLDLTAEAAAMGKATGKDAAAGKATLADLHGADWGHRQLYGLIAQAHTLLDFYGARADVLRAAATFVAARRR